VVKAQCILPVLTFPGILFASLESLKHLEKETKSKGLLKYDCQDTVIYSFLPVFIFSHENT